MRILHLISSPAAGGAEAYVKDLAKEMARMGHSSFIGFISRSRDLGRSLDFERRFLAELELARIPYFFVGHECRRNPILGAFRVTRFCAANRIQIYHSHLKYALVFGALVGSRHVHTHHSITPDAGWLLYRLFNRVVDSYVGISGICASRLSQFTGGSVTEIFNAVDRNRLKQASLPDPGNSRLECIALGRIEKAKNYALLVEAVRLLPTEVRDSIHVSIAGEGRPAEVSELTSVISRSGLDRTINLLGNRDDVPDLLSKSHLFLMCSAWEGLPISLLEASVAGLPFVATDVGGCREVASRCGNGVIVPPGDPQELARAIKELALDRRRLRKLAQNARANAGQFGIERAAEEHLKLYSSLTSAN